MKLPSASIGQARLSSADELVEPRKPTSVSILWRVFTVNTIVFGLAVFILMPFFEQISVNLEWSAQVLGASRMDGEICRHCDLA